MGWVGEWPTGCTLSIKDKSCRQWKPNKKGGGGSKDHRMGERSHWGKKGRNLAALGVPRKRLKRKNVGGPDVGTLGLKFLKRGNVVFTCRACGGCGLLSPLNSNLEPFCQPTVLSQMETGQKKKRKKGTPCRGGVKQGSLLSEQTRAKRLLGAETWGRENHSLKKIKEGDGGQSDERGWFGRIEVEWIEGGLDGATNGCPCSGGAKKKKKEDKRIGVGNRTILQRENLKKNCWRIKKGGEIRLGLGATGDGG